MQSRRKLPYLLIHDSHAQCRSFACVLFSPCGSSLTCSFGACRTIPWISDHRTSCRSRSCASISSNLSLLSAGSESATTTSIVIELPGNRLRDRLSQAEGLAIATPKDHVPSTYPHDSPTSAGPAAMAFSFPRRRMPRLRVGNGGGANGYYQGSRFHKRTAPRQPAVRLTCVTFHLPLSVLVSASCDLSACIHQELAPKLQLRSSQKVQPNERSGSFFRGFKSDVSTESRHTHDRRQPPYCAVRIPTSRK